MANDINMLNDIEDLKKIKGKEEEAKALHSVYTAWFMNGDEAETKKAIKEAKEKFPEFPFDFSGYGIQT